MEHRWKGDLLKRLLIGIISLAVLLWIGSRLFKSDERVIRERLAKLAEAVSVRPNTSAFARLAGADKAMEFFTPDVTVQIEGLEISVHDRADLREAMLAARGNLRAMEVSFSDIHLNFSGERSAAVAYLSAVARLDGQTNSFGRELKMSLRKTGRDWLIAQVESLTLGP
jgi:hypothetical protein